MAFRSQSLRSWAKPIALAFLSLTLSLGVGTARAWALTVPGPVVDVNWLKQNKDKVVLLDVRKKAENFTKKGHIPGAILVPWKKVRAKRVEDGVELIKMLPSPASFARLMKKSGVNNDSAVVITTTGLSAPEVYFGTRLYWQLKYYGHDNVAMLDGGNAAWAAAKLPLSNEPSNPKPGNFTVRAERRELLATTSDVERMVEQGSRDIVDGRTLDYYLGLEQKKKYVYKPGHIPGSKVAPNDLFLAHKGPKTFRSPSEIRATLAALGVDLKAPNTAYCNSGHLGSGLWFVLYELAGNKRAKLYDGSMHAWTKKDRPVNTMKMN